MAKDTSNLSNVLFQLEKGLSCQSCGKVEKLQTHAECGGEQCASCWKQFCRCPQCRQQVSSNSEHELWDLSHILTINAQRYITTTEMPDGPVDAFAFLKALRDYNEECTSTRQEDEQSQEDTKDEDTQQQEPQKRLINRNSFGGMAFFGGDESGETRASGSTTNGGTPRSTSATKRTRISGRCHV